MLTTAQLDAMTPEDRTQLFEQLAAAQFGARNYSDEAARHFNVSRPTVFRWRREHNVPYAVLMSLAGATVGPQPIDDLTNALLRLVELQQENARALEQLFSSLKAFASHRLDT